LGTLSGYAISSYNSSIMSALDDTRSLVTLDRLWYGEQDANGVDLSLIRENLKISPRERLLRADRARRSALRLLEYARPQRETNAGTK
jgi:hypothetical protein